MCKSPFVISVLAVAWLSAASLALAADPPVSDATPPPHASGGIGDDDPLVGMTGDYNLQFVFATQGSGEYLADIRVRVADVKGNTLLDTESPGPLFYLRLAAGTYRISADFHGRTVKKSVAVTDRKQQSLYFYWPREGVEAKNGGL
jgi:hypothetical protein